MPPAASQARSAQRAAVPARAGAHAAAAAYAGLMEGAEAIAHFFAAGFAAAAFFFAIAEGGLEGWRWTPAAGCARATAALPHAAARGILQRFPSEPWEPGRMPRARRGGAIQAAIALSGVHAAW